MPPRKFTLDVLTNIADIGTSPRQQAEPAKIKMGIAVSRVEDCENKSNNIYQLEQNIIIIRPLIALFPSLAHINEPITAPKEKLAARYPSPV